MDASYYKKYEPIFGAWKIKKKLGEGNFGAVFEIEREDFGTTYHAALKAITIPKNQAELDSIMDDGMDSSATQEYLEQVVEKIVSEFVLMSKLKGNSNIVSYEDHQVIRHENGIGWDILIRMELLTPMMAYFKAHTITRRDIIKLGIDMCRALELCQKYNIIHRDIKPENIFISDSGDYKLGDFGIAKEVEKTQSDLTKTGTPTYMAPEVYKGQPYGSSVDLYSLGIVLYRLLNYSRAPFMPAYPNPISYKDKEKAFISRISGQKLPMPTNAGSGRLAEIAMRACSYKPEDRYSSPTQMREDLEAILYTEGEGAVMFPGGDGVEVKTIDPSGVAPDDLTEYIDEEDETETLPEKIPEQRKKKKTTASGKKKKWLIPALGCLCAGILGISAFWALHKAPPAEAEGMEVVLEDPIEFSIDALHMNESDFNLIVKRLDTYGVKYTADKNTKTFAVSRKDLGESEEEIADSIKMLTGVGAVTFGDETAASSICISGEEIESAYTDDEFPVFVMNLTGDGRNKLELLCDEIGDDNDYVSRPFSDVRPSKLVLYVDGQERCYVQYNEEKGNIYIDIPEDLIRDGIMSLFSIKASAAELEPSDNLVKLIISIIVNGEMTKEYDVYIDEKYGVTIEQASPVEPTEKSEDSEAGKDSDSGDSDDGEDSEDSEDSESLPEAPVDVDTSEVDESLNTDTKKEPEQNPAKQPTPEVTVKPTPVCSVCGSTWHTVHPTCPICGSTLHTEHPVCSVCGSTDHIVHPNCAVCGSLDHTVHPTCSVCGSTEHTVHPEEPSVPTGMPEVYVDFD